MSRRVLLISYFFPPRENSGGIRTWRTVKHLSERGFEVSVVTREHRGEDSELLQQLPDSVNIYRAFERESLSISTYRPFWIIPALRKAMQVVRKEDIDVVWSRFTPAAPNVVGLLLKRWSGLPWVVYFGDPWIDSPYRQDNWSDSRWLEKQILTTADRITFSTQRLLAQYKDRYALGNVCEVIPNFTDASEITDVPEDRYQSDKTVFTHLGNLYGVRSPEPLFQALDRLPADTRNRVLVRQIGEFKSSEDLVSKYDVDDVVERLDRMPKNEALEYAKSSDVLLLIDAPVTPSPFLPLKLVEYIHMDRPVLGITPEEGASADVIRETNTGTIVPPTDPSEIAQTIEQMHADEEGGELLVSPDWDAVRQYSGEEAIGKLATILTEVEA